MIFFPKWVHEHPERTVLFQTSTCRGCNGSGRRDRPTRYTSSPSSLPSPSSSPAASTTKASSPAPPATFLRDTPTDATEATTRQHQVARQGAGGAAGSRGCRVEVVRTIFAGSGDPCDGRHRTPALAAPNRTGAGIELTRSLKPTVESSRWLTAHTCLCGRRSEPPRGYYGCADPSRHLAPPGRPR